MTYEEYRAAVISRAKEINPNKLICTEYIGTAFSGHESVEDAAQKVAFDSAFNENDFVAADENLEKMLEKF